MWRNWGTGLESGKLWRDGGVSPSWGGGRAFPSFLYYWGL